MRVLALGESIDIMLDG